MPGERTEIAQLQQARKILDRMRDRLLHPSFESLEDSASDLRLASEYIRRVDAKSSEWQGVQRKALEAEVIGLRRCVRTVEALLANAGKFYAGWARLLSGDSAPPNYSSSGVSNVAESARNLVVHG
jgi:hypothetical protein